MSARMVDEPTQAQSGEEPVYDPNLEPADHLLDVVAADSERVFGPHVLAAAEAARQKFGAAANGVLFYGSCLRQDADAGDILDFYVIVDGYLKAYGAKLHLAILNWLLPPNVFYQETAYGAGSKARAKVGVLSTRHLRKLTGHKYFHSYFWGRFSQPTAIVWARDDDAKAILLGCLAQSVLTMISRVVPLLPQPFSVGDLWRTGLAKSFATELRSEDHRRPGQLVRAFEERYRLITFPALLAMGYELREESRTGRINLTNRELLGKRGAVRRGWGWRTRFGKVLSLLRLIKGAFTFPGGLDYLAWKISRHSGRNVIVKPWQRKVPLIAGAGLALKLWREGAIK